MFEKNSVESTNWKGFFQDILELFYFIDHLNFQKKNVSPFIFAFENLSLETLNMLYILKQNCSFIDLRKVERYKISNDLESEYQLSSSTQKSKLHMSTLGLLINTNPRYEGYVLNLSLRQRILKGDFKLLNVGSMLDLTFPVYNLGSNFGVLKSLSEGTHLSCQDVKNAEFPVIITNTELFKRHDSKVFVEILKYVNVLDTAWNVLNHNLSNAGIQSLNRFLPLSTEDMVNFFGIYYVNVSLNANSNMKKLVDLQLLNIFSSKNLVKNKFFVDQNVNPVNEPVYVKSNLFDNYFHLPSNLFLEDNETYINTQGSIKRITKAIHFKKNAKSNWQITRKLYASTKSLMFFNHKKDNHLINFDCVNFFNFRNYVNFQFYAVQTLTSLTFYLTKQNSPFPKSPTSSFKSSKIKMLDTKVKYWLDDFFNGNGKDSFSYNSSVLVNCSKTIRSSSTNFF